MYLQLNNLSKSFGDNKVVKGLSLAIEKGEILCLLGPSGCGKTTTLKMIGGFLEADSGRIFIDGRDITDLPPEERPVSTVFQSYALFPHLTILDNVIYGLKFQGYSKKDAIQKGMEYLETVGLREYAKAKIHEISGGQQQRVALVRSLIVNPKVLLLDEPLSNLDAKLRIKMREEIKSMQKKLNMTMVFVTHDQEEALVLGDKIAIMNEGDLIQIGSPEEVYYNPSSLFSMNFLGASNKIKDRKEKDFYVRPENVIITPDGDIKGKVINRTFLGFYNQYKIDIGESIIVTKTPYDGKVYNSDDVVNIKLLNRTYLEI
jgi:iron(III) transport system ATP-binding protein